MILFLLGTLGLMGLMYGTGIVLAIKRTARDRELAGTLNAHDGATFLLEARPRYSVSTTIVPLLEGAVTRVAVTGVELSRDMGFRLQGLTRATGSGLEGRLVVDGTKQPDRARRLFAREEVNAALRTLCGARATFKAVNLYPDGDLVVDVAGTSPAEIDDLVERLLRFGEAIDAAASHITDDMPRLGATSGSASSAAFSIDVRS